MSKKGSTLALTALTLAAAVFAPATQAVTITRGFEGLWHDTNAKRGFSAEIIDTAAGKQLVAYWITTDAAGKPLWVIGQGPIVGNKAVLAAVVGNSATAASGTQSWGQMTVTFSDCAHGTVQFAPSDSRQQRGQTTIARLSPDAGKSCSGGISDDHGGADVRIVQFFNNTGVVPAASGKARFEDRSDRSDFKVEAEDLPIGDYSLRVAGVEKATVTVTTSVNGTEGEVEFRSPAEPGKILLDFDPRGQLVEIAQGTTVFLTTKMGTESGGNGDGGGTSVVGSVDRYELRVEGAHDGPEFKARLDSGRQQSEFNVELEDVAVGSYTLNVGGTDRGAIDVVAVQGGTEGEIEFRNPPEPDHLPLDFDPRGQIVQILSNGSVILSGTFPTQPNHGGGGGGGSGGGGSGGSGGGSGGSGGGHGGGNDDPPGDDHGGGGNDDMPGDDHGGGGNGGRHGRH